MNSKSSLISVYSQSFEPIEQQNLPIRPLFLQDGLKVVFDNAVLVRASFKKHDGKEIDYPMVIAETPDGRPVQFSLGRLMYGCWKANTCRTFDEFKENFKGVVFTVKEKEIRNPQGIVLKCYDFFSPITTA